MSKSQELHLASLTRDTERLTNNLEKIRAEIRSVCTRTVRRFFLNVQSISLKPLALVAHGFLLNRCAASLESGFKTAIDTLTYVHATRPPSHAMEVKACSLREISTCNTFVLNHAWGSVMSNLGQWIGELAFRPEFNLAPRLELSRKFSVA